MKYNLTAEQKKKVEELKNMSTEQWESLCKGCGLCCLCKISFNDSETLYTNVHCSNLNPITKSCSIYKDRLNIRSADCKKIDINIILNGKLIPRTCGYVEYVFGPAPFKIHLDWRTTKSERYANMNNPLWLIRHLIFESGNWNSR